MRTEVLEAMEKLDEFLQKYKEVKDFLEDCWLNEENEALRIEIVNRINRAVPAEWTYVYTGNITYRCGSSDGDVTGCLTPLSENAILKELRAFAEQTKEKFCRKQFLHHLATLGGLLYRSRSDEEPEGVDGYRTTICLDSYKESELYSADTYQELMQKRKAEEDRQRTERQAKELAEQKRKQEVQEQQERETLHRLMQKYK